MIDRSAPPMLPLLVDSRGAGYTSLGSGDENVSNRMAAGPGAHWSARGEGWEQGDLNPHMRVSPRAPVNRHGGAPRPSADP